MRVALVQFAADIDSAVNRTTISDLLGRLNPSDRLDLVVLPEASMYDFGAPDDDLSIVAESLDGPFVTLLRGQAQRLGTTIIAGMFEFTGELPFNTLVVISPDGMIDTTYRKIHLYDSFGYRESDRLKPGELAPVTTEVAGLRVGLLTCYDLRFPEHARMLMSADNPPSVIVVAAAWVAGKNKIDHWRTLLQARALENTVFVVATGQGGDRYSGHSLVSDPMGLIVEEAGSEPAVLVVDIDPEHVTKARELNPSLANRRLGIT